MTLSAIWHVHQLPKEVLPRQGIYAALGTLQRIEPRDSDYRLLFEVDLKTGRIPVRLVYQDPLVVGGLYQLVFWAAPVSGPLYPGGFDPQFKFAFDGIKGFGRLQSAIPVFHQRSAPSLSLQELRVGIDRRVRAVLPNQSGAVVSAVLTGHRAGLSQETWDLFRRSGLAHLLAISGLHLSLLAGFVFVMVRGVFWVRPEFSLWIDPQRLATWIAMGAALGYFAISGGSVPTQRALILVLVTGVAVLLGRMALSWRLWSLAVLLVLLIQPSAIFSVGMHLSFLAVAVLIRIANLLQIWQQRREAEGQAPMHPIVKWGAGLVVTTVGINLMMMPILLITFGEAPGLSALTNLIAVPVMGILILPLAFVSLLAMPLGAEGLPLKTLGYVIEALFLLAQEGLKLSPEGIGMVKSPLPLIWPLLIAYAFILRPTASGRLPLIGLVMLLSILLGSHYMPRPKELHHPDGWILRADQNQHLENVGAEKITDFDYIQVQKLWYSRPNNQTAPQPLRVQKTKATHETGPILIYEIVGREIQF